MNAYLDAMRRYATFQGRTSRAAYWRAHLVFGPLMLAAFVWLGLPFIDGPGSVWPALFFLLIVFPHAIPWSALTVRRLHDMGLSGWWALIGLLPTVFVVPIGLVALLLWCAQRGQTRPNRYGPDPDALEEDANRVPLVPPMTGEPTPANATGDVVAELERLARLRESGTLSEAEFAVMKARALGRSGA